MPGTVLVVDDEEDVRFVARTALGAAGFRVEEAANGAQALELFQAGAPDVLVTDLMMPRLDGHALIERVRATAAWDTVQIVVVSASDTGPIPGVATQLRKPVRADDLVAVVRELSERRGAHHA